MKKFAKEPMKERDDRVALWAKLAVNFFALSSFDIDSRRADLLWNVSQRRLPEPSFGIQGIVEVEAVIRAQPMLGRAVLLFCQWDASPVFEASIEELLRYFRERSRRDDDDFYIVAEDWERCLVISHGRWDGRLGTWLLERCR